MPEQPESSHPYQSLHIPKDASFALRPAPGKGWGVFATKDIPRNALILREKPLFCIRKPDEEITQKVLAAEFFRLERGPFLQFLCLRDNGGAHFETLRKLFHQNSFTLAVLDASHSPGRGLFLLLSRFNHSCLPNATLPSGLKNNDGHALYAKRDIAMGEEITFCDNSFLHRLSTADRHHELEHSCDCKACQPGTTFHELSAVRRRLIRAMCYLINGFDVDADTYAAESTIIADPQLRVTAANSAIPISSRLIYQLFLFSIMEEEGLLDDFMVGDFLAHAERTSRAFRNPSSAMIAKSALAQNTWRESLDVAFTLYGREDAADIPVAQTIRRAKERYALTR